MLFREPLDMHIGLPEEMPEPDAAPVVESVDVPKTEI